MATFLRVLVFAGSGWLIFLILFLGRRTKGNPFGKPPIPKQALLLAKLGAAVSFFLLIFRAVSEPPDLSTVLSAVFLFLWVTGILIFTLGISGLGPSLRVGLPQEETALITSGIYGFSRNPIYVGIFLLMGASLAFAFSWLNLVAVAACVVLHHFIILAEERFLNAHFNEYQLYQSRVRRYWGRVSQPG